MKTYFKCLSCENVRAIVKKTDENIKSCLEDYYVAECKCNVESKNYFNVTRDTLERLVHSLNCLDIEWGCDEVVWRDNTYGYPTEDSCLINTAKIYDGEKFFEYEVTRTFHSSFYDAKIKRVTYDYVDKLEYKTREQALKACEEDFKKRKEKQCQQ